MLSPRELFILRILLENFFEHNDDAVGKRVKLLDCRTRVVLFIDLRQNLQVNQPFKV